MPIFINHTNHPAKAWSAAQRAAAAVYGDIVDLPFPLIGPEEDGEAVAARAAATVQDIAACHPAAVLCQGESTYTYAIVRGLRAYGIPVLAATSDRVLSVTRCPDGSTEKRSRFEFIRFRAYC